MVALGFLVSGVAAQTAPAADKAAAVPPIFTDPAAAADAPAATPPATPAPAVPHAISAELAAAILPTLPQYQDSSAQPAAPGAPSAPPRNQVPRLPILLLPPVTVHTKPIREFTERELYTEKGLKELAEKRYMSWLDHLLFNQGLDHFMVEKSLPMAKFEEAEDHERAQEMGELSKLDAMKDPDETPAAAPAKAP